MSTIQFAWLNHDHSINLVINGNSIPKNMLLCDLYGNIIPFKIESSYSDDHFHVIINIPKTITTHHNLYFLHQQKRFYLYPTRELLAQKYTTTELLGANIHNSNLTFSLWSPTAHKVLITLFHPKSNKYLYRYELSKCDHGVWKKKISLSETSIESFHQLQYCYEVTSMGRTRKVIDPYAKSLSPLRHSNQLPNSVVIDPAALKLSSDSFKNNSDLLSDPLEFIGYEAHIRDFTISPDSPVDKKLKGTYEGFGKLAPYFSELGVSHIQLMPVQKFQTVDELNQKYQDESTPMEEVNYNWGYDPMHYFSLEGWFSTNPSLPQQRIIDFHNMVRALHQNNVGVIMDVVYNHIYDERVLEFVAPGCYLRRNSWGDISSGTGAGASVESRNLMVRRLITDSLKYFTEFFHINGYRFDLMSFLDHETMIKIREELGPDIILYGEGWNFTDLPNDQAITKNNYPPNIGLGIFNDSCRDSLIGHLTHNGIIQGNLNENLKAKSSILGGVKDYPHDYNNDGRIDVILGNDGYNYFADDPINTINFLDVHDGFTLWDKINLSVQGDKQKKQRLMRRSLAMLFSSQGRIVIHGGVELARSKALAPNDPTAYRAHTSTLLLEENQGQFFHENSYRSPDATNAIQWTKNFQDSRLYNYVQNLIKLRRERPEMRLANSDEVKRGVRFVEKAPPTARHQVSNFSELPELTINFKNGPKNKNCFLIGEIFSIENGNPSKNPYQLTFDAQGKATIVFSKEDIKTFNTSLWGHDSDLEIKIVNSAGKWDYLPASYSPLGHNLISLYTLSEDFKVTIDLSIKDYYSILEFVRDPSLLAYTLTKNKKQLVVIHNLSSHPKTLQLEAKHIKKPVMINLLTGKQMEYPLFIPANGSRILKIDHPVEELYLELRN